MWRWLARELRLGLAEACRLVLRGFAYGFGACLAVALLCSLVGMAHAEAIPPQAARYRADLTRCARVHWGLSAPVATFAAQVHQESRWRVNARSPVGAQGLAQFMPATARWMPSVDSALAPSAPYNPGWALRALCAYDLWLWERVAGRTPCERMALTLSAYNGGLGWVIKDRRLAAVSGSDPLVWFGSVEYFNAGRSSSAWRENRGYPRSILRTLEPVYVHAGWGLGMCGGAL